MQHFQLATPLRTGELGAPSGDKGQWGLGSVGGVESQLYERFALNLVLFTQYPILDPQYPIPNHFWCLGFIFLSPNLLRGCYMRMSE